MHRSNDDFFQTLRTWEAAVSEEALNQKSETGNLPSPRFVVSVLGIKRSVPYRTAVIACLRFVGILNVAIWLGASVFFAFAVGVAVFSSDMHALLGHSFPYFSRAIAHVIAKRYFALQLICAGMALVHVTAEWLYLGKYPEKLWLGLLLALCVAALLEGYWFEPRLQHWHDLRYGLNTRPVQREAAARAFQAWQTAANMANLLTIAGLALYLWRLANPPDSTRFLSAAKFRS